MCRRYPPPGGAARGWLGTQSRTVRSAGLCLSRPHSRYSSTGWAGMPSIARSVTPAIARRLEDAGTNMMPRPTSDEPQHGQDLTHRCTTFWLVIGWAPAPDRLWVAPPSARQGEPLTPPYSAVPSRRSRSADLVNTSDQAAFMEGAWAIVLGRLKANIVAALAGSARRNACTAARNRADRRPMEEAALTPLRSPACVEQVVTSRADARSPPGPSTSRARAAGRGRNKRWRRRRARSARSRPWTGPRGQRPGPRRPRRGRAEPPCGQRTRTCDPGAEARRRCGRCPPRAAASS